MCVATEENIINIDLQKNASICLDFGYNTLKSAKSDREYRTAIVSIHNGLELLMKLYLKSKDKNLIYENIDHYVLMNERNDLIKPIDKKNLKLHTIKFSECINIISYFINIPETYIQKLNKMRNNCIHYEGIIYKKEAKKILINHIYPLIKNIVDAMGMQLTDFINVKNIESIEELSQSFTNEIRARFLEKVQIAKKHYFEDLTEEERAQKLQYESYNYKKPSKLVQCPACNNRALLKKYTQKQREEYANYYILKQRISISNVSCVHCGLNINEQDLLLQQYPDEEYSLPDLKFNYYYDYDCPDDCPPEDCPYDCPEDCPDDCPPEDCPYDCPEDCPDDCPPEDCPYDCPEDCPDDCPPEDCPYDCPEDCPDDCPPEDCPYDCPEDCPEN